MATYTLRWAKLLNKREAKKEEEILIRNDPRHRSTDRVHLSLSLTLSLSLSSPRVEQYPGCSQSLPNEAHLTRSEYTGHTQTDPSIPLLAPLDPSPPFIFPLSIETFTYISAISIITH